MFKSLVFDRPFGAHLDTSYVEFAKRLVETYPCQTLWSLGTDAPFLYVVADFSRRGCCWFDGLTLGSVFPTPLRTRDFFPPFKSRYRDVPPFMLYGFAPIPQGDSPEYFLVCDLYVWQGRLLTQVPQAEREFLLRKLLARLVDNQPLRFLQEQRLRLPVFLPLPRSLTGRRQLTDSGVDLYVVSAENHNWRVWCPFWLDT